MILSHIWLSLLTPCNKRNNSEKFLRDGYCIQSVKPWLLAQQNTEELCDYILWIFFITNIKVNISICTDWQSVQQTPQLMDASLYQVTQQIRANLLYSESVTTYTSYSLSWHSWLCYTFLWSSLFCWTDCPTFQRKNLRESRTCQRTWSRQGIQSNYVNYLHSLKAQADLNSMGKAL